MVVASRRTNERIESVDRSIDQREHSLISKHAESTQPQPWEGRGSVRGSRMPA